MSIIRTGIVIDNNDTFQKGKIKIRILPEMKDVKENLLPWIPPYEQGSGSSTSSMIHDVPEIDDKIKVIIVDDYWQTIYWTKAPYIKGFYDYTNWTSIKSSMTELGTSTYPQPSFQKFADGTMIFRNSNTGDIGIYHKSGTYCIIDKDGDIVLKSSSKIKVENTLYNLNTDILKKALSVLLDMLSGKLINGAGPVLPNDPSMITNITTAQTALSNLLEE